MRIPDNGFSVGTLAVAGSGSFTVALIKTGGSVDDVRGDLRRIKEMGVDHAILRLTDPDLN